MNCINPHCKNHGGAYSLHEQEQEVDSISFSRLFDCTYCGTAWWEVYTFIQIEILDEHYNVEFTGNRAQAKRFVEEREREV